MSFSHQSGPVLVSRTESGHLTLVVDPAADPHDVLSALREATSAERDPAPAPTVPEQTPRHYAGEFLG